MGTNEDMKQSLKNAGTSAKKFGKATGAAWKGNDREGKFNIIVIGLGTIILGGCIAIGNFATVEPASPVSAPSPAPVEQPADEVTEPATQPTEDSIPVITDEPMGEDYEELPDGALEPATFEDYELTVGFTFADAYGDELDPQAPAVIEIYNEVNDELIWAKKGTVGDIEKTAHLELSTDDFDIDASSLGVRVEYDGYSMYEYLWFDREANNASDSSDNSFSGSVKVVIADDQAQLQMN